jgi:hypothetical protein
MAFIRFADPTFRGGRFEGNALPVDVLPELSAYRAIVIDLAKRLFIQSHPARQQVPRGFIDSFRLVLRSVEPGSARPVLERLVPDNAQVLLFGDDYFARARDQIENAVQAASARHALPNDFPRDLIPQFNQFGKSLRGNEYIELRGPERAAGPRYDRNTRKHLILQYKPEYEGSVDMIAELNGGVIGRRQITFLLPDGGLVDATAPESMVQQVFPIVPSQVRLIGSGIFDENDRLKSIIYIEELTAAEDEMVAQTPIDERIAQLGNLSTGWFVPESAPLDPHLLDSVRELMARLLADGTVPPPYIYPTPEGAVQAEWSFPAWEVSALVSATLVLLHATHLESDEGEDVEIPLLERNITDTMRAFILQFSR